MDPSGIIHPELECHERAKSHLRWDELGGIDCVAIEPGNIFQSGRAAARQLSRGDSCDGRTRAIFGRTNPRIHDSVGQAGSGLGRFISALHRNECIGSLHSTLRNEQPLHQYASRSAAVFPSGDRVIGRRSRCGIPSAGPELASSMMSSAATPPPIAELLFHRTNHRRSLRSSEEWIPEFVIVSPFC